MRVSGYGTIMSFNEIEYIFNTTIGYYTLGTNWCFDLDDWEWVNGDPFELLKSRLQVNGYTVDDIWTDPDDGHIIINGKEFIFSVTVADRFDLDENSINGAVRYEYNYIME
jgi:hypothetical protein